MVEDSSAYGEGEIRGWDSAAVMVVFRKLVWICGSDGLWELPEVFGASRTRGSSGGVTRADARQAHAGARHKVVSE